MMFIYDNDIIMSKKYKSCRQNSILDVPDEILEDNLLTLLSLDDLMNLMIIGNVRLIGCCCAVIKKKQLKFKEKG